MRKLLQVLPLVAVMIASLAVATPAQADAVDTYRDWDLYRRVWTYGPEESPAGGSVRSDVRFPSRHQVVFVDFTVNDICPGDGNHVIGRPIVLFMDGTRWVGPRYRTEPGTTCREDGLGHNFGDKDFSFAKRIKAARAKVCVVLDHGRKCRVSNRVFR